MSLEERIIEESAKMFARQGVKAIRMDDIATKLAISKRTIYEMFKDKDTLIERSLIYHFEQMERQQIALIAEAENVIERFILVLDDWDRTMPFNFNLMEGVQRYYPNIYDRIALQRNSKGYERFKSNIVEGMSQGLFMDNIDIDLAVSVFAESIFGIISRADKFLPNSVSASEAFKYVLTYFFRGISTDKGIKILDNYINKK